MNDSVFKTVRPVKAADESIRKNFLRENGWFIAMGSSLMIALSGSFAGMIISGLSYLNYFSDRETMKILGTLLIVFAAPLYFLAAHCLDKLDLQQTKRK